MNGSPRRRARYIGRRLVQKLGAGLRLCGLGWFLDLLSVPCDAYAVWRAHHDLTSYALTEMQATVRELSYKPLFSICMPVYEPPISYLRAAVESVRAQVYPHWQLCIADDGTSSSPEVLAYLDELRDDSRIRLVLRQDHGGIVQATNDALALATGEYIAFLDHDDQLAAHALYRFALVTITDPSTGIIYSDEDKLDTLTGCRYDPYFKPDWSPETLLSKMYIGHLLALRRDLVLAVGGMRQAFEGSQDYDLVLRVSERTTRIVHVPDVLYHWRAHARSTAQSADQKPYAIAAAAKAVTEALERRSEPGAVVGVDGCSGRFRVRYFRASDEPVTIVIPTRDKSVTLTRALESIFTRSTYANFSVTVVDNGSTQRATAEVLASWRRREPKRFRVIRDDGPFNYSALNNRAVREVQSPYVVLLNNDTTVVSPDWLEAMLEYAQRPAIGAVGGLLLYPDGRVQHAGVVIGIGGLAGHILKRSRPNSHAYYDALNCVTNYSAVTAACLMIRRQVYEEIGGLNEQFPVAWNDVDFCLRLGRAGFRNVYLPHVRLTHYESLTRGRQQTPEDSRRNAREILELRDKWKIARGSDPYYNPWLTLEREDASLAP